MLRDDDGSDAMPTIAIDCHGRNACRELLPFEAAIGTQAALRVQARGHGSARFFLMRGFKYEVRESQV